MATTQQPLNPYIAGRAVGGERGFFGRQDILREAERTLTSPDQNALVLFSQQCSTGFAEVNHDAI